MILARREQAETFGVAANFDGKYISNFKNNQRKLWRESAAGAPILNHYNRDVKTRGLRRRRPVFLGQKLSAPIPGYFEGMTSAPLQNLKNTNNTRCTLLFKVIAFVSQSIHLFGLALPAEQVIYESTSQETFIL